MKFYVMLAVAIAATASSATAAGFTFDNLGPSIQTPTGAKELRSCFPIGSDKNFRMCKLVREDFGGVVIRDSQVELKSGYLHRLTLTINSADVKMAVSALEAKFGKSKFDDNWSCGTNSIGSRVCSDKYLWAFDPFILEVSTRDGDPDARIEFSNPATRNDAYRSLTKPKVDF